MKAGVRGRHERALLAPLRGALIFGSVSGGVASLDHRLHAGKPPASGSERREVVGFSEIREVLGFTRGGTRKSSADGV